jgi:hypothetical protein
MGLLILCRLGRLSTLAVDAVLFFPRFADK